MKKAQWFPVPVTICEENGHDPEKIAAEIYLRCLAHYSGTITTSERAIAGRLGCSRSKIRRVIEDLIKLDHFHRTKTGPKQTHLTVVPLVGKESRRTNTDPIPNHPHYKEKDIIEESEFLKKRKKEEEDRNRRELEQKRRIFGG